MLDVIFVLKCQKHEHPQATHLHIRNIIIKSNKLVRKKWENIKKIYNSLFTD